MKRHYFSLFLTTAFFAVVSSCSSSRTMNFSGDFLDVEDAAYYRKEIKETTDNRMITYSVSLNLSVKNTDETRKMLVEYVKNNKGFIVKETDNYGNL